MDIREQYARTICTMRGADPDQPLTIGYPDGSSAAFERGWEAYTDIADALLALHEG